MENIKKLNLKDLEDITGGIGPDFLLTGPGQGLPKYGPEEKDEPKDGGATGSW